MEEFPSGQRGQTVNLLSLTSMVRIHPPPPQKSLASAGLFCCTEKGSPEKGSPRRLPFYHKYAPQFHFQSICYEEIKIGITRKDGKGKYFSAVFSEGLTKPVEVLKVLSVIGIQNEANYELPKQVDLLKTPCYNQINRCVKSKNTGVEVNET